MPKLLYLSYFFPPMSSGETPRNLMLSRYLTRLGWDVQVLTCSNPRGMPEDPDLLKLIPDGVRITRVHHSDPAAIVGRGAEGAAGEREAEGAGLRSTLRRWLLIPDRVMTWAPTLLPRALRTARAEGADIIMSAGPPHSLHMISALLARATGARLVPYFGDLWARDSNVDLRSPALAGIHRGLEGLVVSASSGLVTTTPGSSQYFRRTWGRLCPPVLTVLNGYDPNTPVPEGEPSGEGGMRVVYTGNVVGCNTVEFLPRGISLFLSRNPGADVSFHFFGGLENDYGSRLTEPPLDRVVRVHGTVSRMRAAEEQVQADLLLSFLADRPGAELKNPTKMAEYARSGRPVLAAAPEGDMTRIVERLRMGYTVPPTAEGVARGLEEAWRDYASSRKMPKPDGEEVAEVYDSRLGFRRLDRFLRARLPGGSGQRAVRRTVTEGGEQ